LNLPVLPLNIIPSGTHSIFLEFVLDTLTAFQ
jgi:hypothetical protein